MMENIKNTAYVLAVVAIATGLLDVLNSTEKLNKYTQYITSLVIIICILSPLKNTVYEIYRSSIKYNITENKHNDESEKQLKETLCSAITNDLSNKLSIPYSVLKIDIKLTQTQEDKIIKLITVTVTTREYNRYSERIEYYLKSNYGCETKIIQCFEE